MIVSGNLTNEEVDQVLTNGYIGRIGCHANGKTYVVPVTYYYDEKTSSIVSVSGEGKKLEMLRNSDSVCFEAEHIENISNWKTVIAWGNFEELTGADARKALHSLVNKVRSLLGDQNNYEHPLFMKDISNASTQESNSVIYRIKLSERTGKFEKS